MADRKELFERGLPPDPWAKFHAWRFNGPLSKARNVQHMFPGLGIAIVAFSTYVFWDNYIRLPTPQHHGDAHHGDAHHGSSSAHH